MKENSNMLKQRLKRAIETSTPDNLPEILQRIKENKENIAEMIPASIGKTQESTTSSQHITKYKIDTTWVKRIASLAAVFMLVFAIQAVYSNYIPQTIINLDVNPSVEIKVNKAERVLAVTPLNEDAKTIIGDMDFKKVDLDIAINALIGSMVRNGYISSIKNSILISVDSTDKQQGERLRRRLSNEVEDILSGYSVNGAVLSQSIHDDDRLNELAREHNISLGKAALVDLLVNQDATLQFANIAGLPINDINLLIAERYSTMKGVATIGKASSEGYIGKEKAKSIALTHADVPEKSLQSIEIEIDHEYGHMIYEVEFRFDNAEYEYEIDAASGKILGVERKTKNNAKPPTTDKHQHTSSPPAKPSNNNTASQYIGKDKAKRIALNHVGLTESAIKKLEVELDRTNGKVVYEVEFVYSDHEYEYDIDAVTGEIVKWEYEKD